MATSPQPPKYSARVEKSDVNTSHAQVLDLVGTDKRVLDVGCASGYLSEALVAAGNKVSGVEIDPVAAAEARRFLDRIVVGDLEQTDLVEEFGPASFDVIVFADVLEHLRDPVEVLRRSRGLLAEGGYAVLSIPNVAHGSVRLALLTGRFEYSRVGLLDDTHVRFFTRHSFEQLVADAGFYPTDSRQTTADAFSTEIRLDPALLPPDAVAAVQADPESQVYQFVARVDPLDSGSGDPEGPLAARSREVHQLRRQLAEIARLAGRGSRHPVLGVVDPGGEEMAALRSLRLSVAAAEMRRRLPGFEIRTYCLAAEAPGSGLGDEAVQPLLPWSPSRADDLRAQLEGLIVLPGEADPAGRTVLDDLAERELPVSHLDDGADPLLLVARIIGAEQAADRRPYLQLTGQVPDSGAYLLALGAGSGPDMATVADLARASDQMVVEAGGPLGAMDLLGLVAGADAVVTASPAVLAATVALGRPALRLADPAGRAPAWTASYAASGREAGTGAAGPGDPGLAAPAATRLALAALVDLTFDELAARFEADGRPRLGPDVRQRLLELEERLALLEQVNAGLRQTLAQERARMGAELVRLANSAPPEPHPAHRELAERLSVDLAQAGSDLARLQGEIDRIYSTRTMRAVAPLRRIYSLVRPRRPAQ